MEWLALSTKIFCIMYIVHYVHYAKNLISTFHPTLYEEICSQALQSILQLIEKKIYFLVFSPWLYHTLYDYQISHK